MKSTILVIILSVTSSLAFSEVVGKVENKAKSGGEIVFTNEQCEIPEFDGEFKAISYNSEGDVVYGCFDLNPVTEAFDVTWHWSLSNPAYNFEVSYPASAVTPSEYTLKLNEEYENKN